MWKGVLLKFKHSFIDTKGQTPEFISFWTLSWTIYCRLESDDIMRTTFAKCQDMQNVQENLVRFNRF